MRVDSVRKMNELLGKPVLDLDNIVYVEIGK